MTTKRIARSLFKDAFFLMLLIAPLSGVAVYLWSVKVKDQLAAARKSHSLAHIAIEGFVSRDIDDLESQLANSVENKNTFLSGDFRFRMDSNTLSATHTSAPAQPLTISLEGEMAFSKPLNQVAGQNFVIVTKNGEIVSHSKSARKEALGTLSDAKIMNAELSRPLALSDFDSTRVWALSTSRFLTEQPRFVFTRTQIAKSNLLLFSYNDLRPLWKESVASLAYIVGAAFAAMMLGLGAMLLFRSRQARNQAWLNGVFESLRFGRLDVEYPGARPPSESTEFYAQVQESLGKNTSLRRFLETDWIDSSRSSVSWNFFKQSIAHWGEGLSTESDAAPTQWYLGSGRVRSPEFIEVFQRALTNEFGTRTVRIYQSGEKEFSFALRDIDVASCLEKLKRVLRATSAGTCMTTNDFAISTLLISKEIPGASLKALAETQERCRRNFDRGLHVLIETCVELRHYQTGTELCTFGLSDPKEESVATTVTKFPKRAPVSKPSAESTPKRPQLPPPPTLKTKNMRAGKGFIRITDALGKAEWVEISSNTPSPSLQTQEIVE